jgi:hypothetical protein
LKERDEETTQRGTKTRQINMRKLETIRQGEDIFGKTFQAHGKDKTLSYTEKQDERDIDEERGTKSQGHKVINITKTDK